MDDTDRRQLSQWQCIVHFGLPSNSYSMLRQWQRPRVVSILAVDIVLVLRIRSNCMQNHQACYKLKILSIYGNLFASYIGQWNG